MESVTGERERGGEREGERGERERERGGGGEMKRNRRERERGGGERKVQLLTLYIVLSVFGFPT